MTTQLTRRWFITLVGTGATAAAVAGCRQWVPMAESDHAKLPAPNPMRADQAQPMDMGE